MLLLQALGYHGGHYFGLICGSKSLQANLQCAYKSIVIVHVYNLLLCLFCQIFRLLACICLVRMAFPVTKNILFIQLNKVNMGM